MTEDQWIKCSDELPPNDEDVLFVEVDYADAYVRFGYYDTDLSHWVSTENETYPLPTLLDPTSGCGVSHWKRAPALPAELAGSGAA